LDTCSFYHSKINLDNCENCKDRSTCSIYLIVSRLNRLESKVRRLEAMARK
jgi:hypothetical protein